MTDSSPRYRERRPPPRRPLPERADDRPRRPVTDRRDDLWEPRRDHRRDADRRPTGSSRATPLPPVRRQLKLRHRPALDGLRGLAVASCLTYQMITEHFTGGWLGIDMFLTISGFFIAAMLLQERRTTGTVDYWAFIKRRGRRLLPGHLLLLAGTLVVGFFLLPAGRHKSLAGDVAASVVEMVNWRFISNEQSYFNNISLPSPLRHMWSLSVQEQYYVLFPLILILVSKVISSRRGLFAFFAGLTLLSLWRMHLLYVPGTDPSRVYFGTDTRIFEVLIGVLGAFLLSERAFAVSKGVQHRGWLHRHDRALGWAGLASLGLLFYFMITLSEYSPWLFQGGLAIVCLLTMVAIIAASSPYDNLMQRLLSWAPLRWVGRMGFSLYIWHWPLVVFTALALPDVTLWARNCISMTLTVAIAWASHRYVESPIHRGGVKAFLPTRPTLRKVVALGAAPALLVGSGALWLGADAAAREAGGDNLVLPMPDYTPRATASLPVVLLGNSVATGLATRGEVTKGAPDIKLDLDASLGCSPFIRDAYESDTPKPPTKECIAWRDSWPSAINRDEKPVVAYLLSMNYLADYKVDGRLLEPGTPEHDQVIRGILDEIRQRAFDAGAGGFVIYNVACHERFDFGGDLVVTRSNDMSLVKHLNAVAFDWARPHKVTVVDTFGALCPGDTYYNRVNDVPLYDDTVHYSVSSAPMIYRWMAPSLQAAALARGTDEDGLADLRD